MRLGRVRLLDGEPLAIEHAVVPKRFLPPIDEVEGSLYKAFEAMGNRPVGGTQSIHASLATPTEAGMLSIAEQSAVLRIERITRNAKGDRSEEHTSELQSLMRISYAVFCLKKKTKTKKRKLK